MKTRNFFIVSLLGAILLSACSEKKVEFSEKDAFAYITVLDESGNPVGGAPVLIYDEKGYEAFQKDRTAPALGGALTLPDGKVKYRLPYQKWFASGSRVVTFVVMQEDDPDNYRIWTVRRTIRTAQKVQIDFKLDKDLKTVTGTPLDIFDENNGRTLFGNAVYLSASQYLMGANRYSFVDAGVVSDLNAFGELKLDGLFDKMAVQPQHGYFVYKDISLREFPSGSWGVSIAAECVNMYVSDWLYRNGKVVGITVQYSVYQPANPGLPAWDTVYDTKLSDERGVTIPLPTKFGACECVSADNKSLQFSFGEDHVTIRVMSPTIGKEYRFYIRSGVYYTEAKLRVVA